MANVIVTAVPTRPVAEFASAAEGGTNELDKQLKKACQQQSDNPISAGWVPSLPVPAEDKLPVILPRSASLKLKQPVADHQYPLLSVATPSGLAPPLLAKVSASSRHQPHPALKPLNELAPSVTDSQALTTTERTLATATILARLHTASEVPINREVSPALPVDKSRAEDKRATAIPSGIAEKSAWQPPLKTEPLPTSEPSRLPLTLPDLPEKRAAAGDEGKNRISYAFSSWGDKHRVQLTATRDVNQQLAVMINPSDPLVSKRLHEAINSLPPTTGVILADESAKDQQQRRDKQSLSPEEDEE